MMTGVPHFICVGCQKAGTDWVYDQFRSHRDFDMPPFKELHYFNRLCNKRRRDHVERRIAWMTACHGQGHDFSREIRFLNGMLGFENHESIDFEYYKNMFLEYTPLATADVSPGYTGLQGDVYDLIARNLPGTRCFLIVRDPVERIWSQALMHERLGGAGHGWHFQHAATELDEFEALLANPQTRRLSSAASTISACQAAFSDRFAVFMFDDLRENPERFRRELCDFLGVHPYRFTIPASFNKKAGQPGKRAMPSAFAKKAARVYEAEYEALEKLLGAKVTDWTARNRAQLSAP